MKMMMSNASDVTW